MMSDMYQGVCWSCLLAVAGMNRMSQEQVEHEPDGFDDVVANSVQAGYLMARCGRFFRTDSSGSCSSGGMAEMDRGECVVCRL
jgi:hypothetical protein